VGLHKPFASATLVGLGAVALSGCDNQASRFGMPSPLSSRGTSILHLWQGAWIAALITGAITWALIFYAMWRFRRRSDSEIPVQTRYNLPLEIFYTIAPVFMVIVFFAWTVKAQDAVLQKPADPTAVNVIEVTGQQWQWTFNYGIGANSNADGDKNAAELNQSIADYFRSFKAHQADPSVPLGTYPFDYKQYAYLAGDGSNIPVLVLPEGVTTRFNLHSPDVIHDFGVTDFLEKMDVVPGRVNHYWVTPDVVTAVFDANSPDNNFLAPNTAAGYNANASDTSSNGHYYLRDGACYELCGEYHSRMLFRVAIVSPADYAKYVAALAQRNLMPLGQGPNIGGMDAVIASTGVEAK
jgi:cytochrome c oxidase subunit 2